MGKKRGLSESLKAIADKMAGQGEGGVFDFEQVVNERPSEPGGVIEKKISCDCEDKEKKITIAADEDDLSEPKPKPKPKFKPKPKPDAGGATADPKEVVVDALQTAIDAIKGEEGGGGGGSPDLSKIRPRPEGAPAEGAEDDIGQLPGDEMSVPMPDSDEALWHGDGDDAVGGQPFTCSATPTQIVATDCDGCEYNAEGGGKVDCQFPTAVAKGGFDPIDRYVAGGEEKAAAKIAAGQELDVCSNCGFSEDHDPEIQTRDKVCPQCGGTMVSKTARRGPMARRRVRADVPEKTRELIENRPRDREWDESTEYDVKYHDFPKKEKSPKKKTPPTRELSDIGIPPQTLGMLATLSYAATKLTAAGKELGEAFKNPAFDRIITDPIIAKDIEDYGKFSAQGASGVKYCLNLVESSPRVVPADLIHELGIIADTAGEEGQQFCEAVAGIIMTLAKAVVEDKPPELRRLVKPENMPATTGIKAVDEALAVVEQVKKEIPEGFLPEASRRSAGIADAIKRAWSAIKAAVNRALGLKDKAFDSMEELIALTERIRQEAGGSEASRREGRKVVARDAKGGELKPGDIVRVISRDSDVRDFDGQSVRGRFAKIVRARSGFVRYPEKNRSRLGRVHELYVVGSRRDWHGVVYGDEVVKESGLRKGGPREARRPAGRARVGCEDCGPQEPQREPRRRPRTEKELGRMEGRRRTEGERRGPAPRRRYAQAPAGVGNDPELQKAIDEKAKEIADQIKQLVDKQLARPASRRPASRRPAQRRPARRTADSYDQHQDEETSRVDSDRGKVESQEKAEYQRRKKEWDYAKWAARRRRTAADEYLKPSGKVPKAKEINKPGTKAELPIGTTTSVSPLDKSWKKVSERERARRRARVKMRREAEEFLYPKDKAPKSKELLDPHSVPNFGQTDSTEPMGNQWSWKGVAQAVRDEVKKELKKEIRKDAKGKAKEEKEEAPEKGDKFEEFKKGDKGDKGEKGDAGEEKPKDDKGDEKPKGKGKGKGKPKPKDEKPKDEKPKGEAGSVEDEIDRYLDEHLEELVEKAIQGIEGGPEKGEGEGEFGKEGPEEGLGADMDFDLDDVETTGDFGMDFGGGAAPPLGEDIIPFDDKGNESEFPKVELKTPKRKKGAADEELETEASEPEPEPEPELDAEASVDEDLELKAKAARRLARLMVKVGAAPESEMDEATDSIMDNHTLDEIQEKIRDFRDVASREERPAPQRRRAASRRPDRIELPERGNSGMAVAARLGETSGIVPEIPDENEMDPATEFGLSMLGDGFGKGMTAE